jgi:peptidoglycan/xylan/chitin deacetylase (PgdA/CDA1 family)
MQVGVSLIAIVFLACISYVLVFWYNRMNLMMLGPHQPPAPLHLTPVEMKTIRIDARRFDLVDKNIYISELFHGDLHSKDVALTFDDGPHPQWTPKLLRILEALKVHATFFVVGKMVDKYPYLVAQEVLDGDEVENHTYDHISMKHLNGPQVRIELEDGAAAIRRITGYTPYFFRPPGGGLTDEGKAVAAQLHMTSVMWTANSKDFTYPPDKLLEARLMDVNHNGAILLCHDGIPETMQILPDLVRRLRSQGYRFVTISVLARHLIESEERISRRPAFKMHAGMIVN